MLERDGYEQFSGNSIVPINTKTTSTIVTTLKSIGAVFAGLLAITVLSVGADLVMHATGIYPPWGEPMADSKFALATGYRTVFAIAGSYLSAGLAPVKPMHHAIALGIVGVVFSLIGTIATWNGGPEYGRKWYPITLILISIPCGWLGGKLQQKISERRHSKP
ncbi:MAG TPA: hypothetical protein VI306_19135 [Pyrinomonadaceae bacterium]